MRVQNRAVSVVVNFSAVLMGQCRRAMGVEKLKKRRWYAWWEIGS